MPPPAAGQPVESERSPSPWAAAWRRVCQTAAALARRSVGRRPTVVTPRPGGALGFEPDGQGGGWVYLDGQRWLRLDGVSRL